MKINHIAIWSSDIERLKRFYVKYFEVEHTDRYKNETTGFSSYFLKFSDEARIEIMNKPGIIDRDVNQEFYGYSHMAISV